MCPVGSTHILNPPKYLKDLQHSDFLDPSAASEGTEESAAKWRRLNVNTQVIIY